MAAAASTLQNPVNNILSLKLPEKMYHYMYAPYFQAIPAPQQASLPVYPPSYHPGTTGNAVYQCPPYYQNTNHGHGPSQPEPQNLGYGPSNPAPYPSHNNGNSSQTPTKSPYRKRKLTEDHKSKVNESETFPPTADLADSSAHEIEKLDMSHLWRIKVAFHKLVVNAQLLGDTVKKTTAISKPWRNSEDQNKTEDNYPRASADVNAHANVTANSTEAQDLKLTEQFLTNEINLVKAMIECSIFLQDVGAREAVSEKAQNSPAANCNPQQLPTGPPPGVAPPKSWHNKAGQLVNRELVLNTKYRTSLIELEKARRDLDKELVDLLTERVAVSKGLEDITVDSQIEWEWSFVTKEGQEGE